MTRDKVIQSIEELYNNLDFCISKLVKARLDKDIKAEGDALFSMEGLIVASQQELSFLHDYIQKQAESQGLDEAAEEYVQTLADRADENLRIDTTLQTAFKAGAKWRASKMPMWRKIKRLEMLPCRAYLFKLAYESEANFKGFRVDGLLMPNEPVMVGCDTWYLPVDEIKNLPREE